MPTHRTKVSYIDAIQYTTENDADVAAFIDDEVMFISASVIYPHQPWAVDRKVLWINNNSWQMLEKFDWIIKQTNGTFIIAEPNYFGTMYEENV